MQTQERSRSKRTMKTTRRRAVRATAAHARQRQCRSTSTGVAAERGLSIRTLAERSELNVNTLSLIENSKTSPSVSTLQQIAAALEVPIDGFL